MGAMTFALSDQESLSDSLLLLSGILIRDTLGFSDTIDYSNVQANLLIGDNLNFTDSFIANTNYLPLNTDIILLLDSQVVQLDAIIVDIPKTASDTLSFSDALAVNKIYIPTVDRQDTINLSDAATVILLDPPPIQIVVVDTFSFGDSLQYVRSNSRLQTSDRFLLNDECFVLLNSTPNAYLRRYLNDVN